MGNSWVVEIDAKSPDIPYRSVRRFCFRRAAKARDCIGKPKNFNNSWVVEIDAKSPDIPYRSVRRFCFRRAAKARDCIGKPKNFLFVNPLVYKAFRIYCQHFFVKLQKTIDKLRKVL